MLIISSPPVTSARTSDESGPTASVGRIGALRLRYAKRDDKTIIARSHCTSPWHLLPPIYLDDSGAAYTLLLNPSGGLVGGDRLSIDVSLDERSHVIVSSPSANRVYRSIGAVSAQEIKLRIGAGAILEWFPEHTIPFAGSRYHQSIHATLGAGASVVLWDAISAGRIGCGERWAFATLENEIRIVTASGASLLERFALDPKTDMGQVGLAGQWDYVGSLYVINDAIPAETWSRLETAIAPILDTQAGLVLGGVSIPAAPGIAVKLLARTAPALLGVMEALWSVVRLELWNLPMPDLRKY